MNEVIDAGSLELVGACGIAGNDKFGTTVEILVCLGSEDCVFVVARAEHHNIGLLGESCVDTLFNGIEAEIVDDFVACATEEVGRELSSGKTHGEIAYSKHKHFGTAGSGLGGKTEFFKIGGGALHGESVGALLGVAAAVAAATAVFNLVGGFLVHVGILVGAEQHFFAACHVGVALLARSVYSPLNVAVAYGIEETSSFLCLEE